MQIAPSMHLSPVGALLGVFAMGEAPGPCCDITAVSTSQVAAPALGFRTLQVYVDGNPDPKFGSIFSKRFRLLMWQLDIYCPSMPACTHKQINKWAARWRQLQKGEQPPVNPSVDRARLTLCHCVLGLGSRCSLLGNMN